MKKLFGTDGMRARAGEFPLDAATIETVGRSLARQFAESTGALPRFLTGRDTRESGSWIEAAIQRGIRAEGGTCHSAGVMTTPGVAFLTRAFDYQAGIVISASHNPFEDNGIKVFSPSGKKIDSRIERRIEVDVFEAAGAAVSESQAPDEIEAGDREIFAARYLEHLTSGFAGLDLRGLRIVADCANGASSDLAPPLFRSLGADVVAINDKPNGRNINENCGSLHLEQLRERVLIENADLGVGFDGDADRALFVDEKGSIVDGDAVLWVMARLFAGRGRLNSGTVVATVMSNLGLEIALGSQGIKLLRTSVGDKYVLEELLRTKAEVGGEQSGHIIFPQTSLVGDGMMTALFLLEAIRDNGSPLSTVTLGFTRYPQILINVNVREKRPFEEVEAISAATRALENRLGSGGRLLLRYSGTENLARVMIEGENQSAIETDACELAEIIRANLG